jgi:hypothetical protein
MVILIDVLRVKSGRFGDYEFKGSRVQEFKSLRVQEFKSLRVQEFKSLRVQEFKGLRLACIRMNFVDLLFARRMILFVISC